MAGMYPDNQSIELFGESVQWPGVDAGGKFTNGSFSDPQVKPSFIPAQTINLILDNLAALITELGGTPNNTGPNQLAMLCTAVRLLERIKSVAGANSGLDADTLDGQQGTYYAPLGSPNLTGTPTAPTAAAGTNNTQIATTAFVRAAITALIDSSPATLDTLNELAAALGNDPNFATTIAAALALKAPLASPGLTGTPTAPTAAAGTNNTQIATTAFVRAAIDQPAKPPETTTDKTLLGESTGGKIELSLPKGWYYVELQGGGGGKVADYTTRSSSDGGSSGSTSNYKGNYGQSGYTISTAFFLPYDAQVILIGGSTGTNGVDTDPGTHSTGTTIVLIPPHRGSPSYLLVPQYGICIPAAGGAPGSGHNSSTDTPPLAAYARIYKKNE